MTVHGPTSSPDRWRVALLIFGLALLILLPLLGAIPLFDWDEVNFAEAAREMILTHDYTRVYIDFAPFWEKPPLFFWLQAGAMHLWGIGAFAARFPNALCGAITLSALYLIGRRLYDHRFGILWVMAYGGSVLPQLYFRSGIIDPWFNVFIFLSLYFLIARGGEGHAKTPVRTAKGPGGQSVQREEEGYVKTQSAQSEEEKGHAKTQRAQSEEEGHAKTQRAQSEEEGHAKTQRAQSEEEGHAKMESAQSEEEEGHAKTQRAQSEEEGHAKTQSAQSEEEKGHAKTQRAQSEEEGHAKMESAQSEEEGHAKTQRAQSEEEGHAKMESAQSEEEGHAKSQRAQSEEEGHAKMESAQSEEEGHAKSQRAQSEEEGHAKSQRAQSEEEGHAKSQRAQSEEEGHAKMESVQSDEEGHVRALRSLRPGTKYFGNSSVLAGGILLGLAVLTKGPVAYLIVLFVVGGYWIVKRFRTPISILKFLLFSVIAVCTFGLWYGVETLRNGPWFISQFVRYQFNLLIHPGAGHAGFPGYHVVVLLLGCFPASVFAIQPLFRKYAATKTQSEFRLWMILLLLVVLILFTIVRSKIVHYSSLCYFPLTWLATLYVWRLINIHGRVGIWQKVGFMCIGLLYVIGGIALVYFGRHPDQIEQWVMLDHNARASLSMHVSWQWWDVLPVLLILGAILTILFMPSAMLFKKIVLVYFLTGAFVYAGIDVWVDRIQRYTQGPATVFFTSLAGKDAYAIPWGYKSYAQYWEFRKPPPQGFSINANTSDKTVYKKSPDADYLLTSPDVDKDVYVITKADKEDEFQRRYPGVLKTGEEGGFVFFLKKHE